MPITVTRQQDGSFKVEGVIARSELGPIKAGKVYSIAGKPVTPSPNRTYYTKQTERGIPWGEQTLLDGTRLENSTANISFNFMLKASNFSPVLSETQQLERKRQATINTARGNMVAALVMAGKTREEAEVLASESLQLTGLEASAPAHLNAEEQEYLDDSEASEPGE